ncbi:MAG: hypothetical protein QF486_06780 [Candidatus Woesearchaeota archaeon]|jgi:hypothetical protein|nr:hypothetical protein [Candidatus Woesearchaeota archaeon]MDP7182121.1 hypothetical protein [Candidatus Woesearchaeota archaeon]MDP7199290.1 hypothetical protein [Candidatus Woesearchaeota archaeon]MDP7467911.1 hypothetical protein [Candidatus Woesearchaeota archaeon]MDP7647883.1 hypothetical protein [Candidatus Woesearchaeota archaeon]|tara:strand:- start:277 stop:519 length:243 start_codon:yes stop_codon:yes gene_type:complete
MDTKGYNIRPSKHFITKWMRNWDCDVQKLRQSLEEAHKVDKVGKTKYEAYSRIGGKSRKIIFVKDDEFKDIFIITGAEGK